MTRTPSPGARAAVAATLCLAVAAAGCTGLSFSDNVGSKARDLVSSSPYTKLVVEIDWLVDSGKSYEPSSSVTNFLKQRLDERLSKPGGVTIELSDAITATKTTYTIDDIRGIESTYRQRHSGGDTAAVWILFGLDSADSVGGGYEVGVAYAGTSCVVFAKTIADHSTFFVTADSVEKIVVVHEFGHLMGLVNLGAPMVTAHEDTAHPHHSTNTNSVMYWQVEGGGVFDILRGGGSPDNFDANDIADLQGIGGR